jgi:phage baseplate assembly protein V
MDPAELQLPDLLRRLENIVRMGTVAEVRHTLPAALVRVRSGGNTTDWRPYVESRAGDTRTWNPPTIGEQVVLLSPGGDLAGAIVLGGIHQNDHPAPSTDPNRTVTVHPDGATVVYDHATHALRVELPADGTADITVPGRVTVRCGTADITADGAATVHAGTITLDAPDTLATGNLTVAGVLTYQGGMMGSGVAPGAASSAVVQGDLSASGDVQAGAVSLRGHVHGGVRPGDGSSGAPR